MKKAWGQEFCPQALSDILKGCISLPRQFLCFQERNQVYV